MKKKSSIFFLCILCTAVLLSGCANARDLTDAERDAIAEYVAYLLLKYDRDYESRLVETISVPDNPYMVEEEFTVIGEQTESSGGKNSEEDSSDKTGNSGQEDGASSQNGTSSSDNAPAESQEKGSVTLKELFADEGVQVSFDGYQEYSTYPEDSSDSEGESFFSLVAPEGKKLAVLKFTVRNTSKKEQTFRQVESEIRYRLEVDEKTVVQPSMTLLVNDLQYVDTVLKPEEKMEAVVVFTVDKEVKLAGASLIAFTEIKTASEKLK